MVIFVYLFLTLTAFFRASNIRFYFVKYTYIIISIS